jgi:hypothetical protein
MIPRERRPPRRLAVFASALVLCWSRGGALSPAGLPPPPAYADARPEAAPPDAPLLQRVRANLLRDDLIDELYTFRIHRRSYEVSPLGKVDNGPEQVFEVVPSPVDPEQRFRRLVAVDGRPVPPEELRKADERHRREALEDRQSRDRETPRQRARRLAEEAKREAEDRQRLDDVFEVLRIEVDGREVVEGQTLLAVTLTPRPGARPRTDEGRHLQRIRGRAWVDEAEGQLVRIEVQLVEDLRIGLGIIGRVHAGSRAVYRRARLADGTWAPVEARFVGSGRTLMLRPFHIESWAKYTDYRRLSERDTRGAGIDPRSRADRQ